MWCDVSQVSFARGTAHTALSFSLAIYLRLSLCYSRTFTRPLAVLFSHNPLPLLARARVPSRCAFPSFGVCDTRAAFPRFVPAEESGYVSVLAGSDSCVEDRERATWVSTNDGSSVL